MPRFDAVGLVCDDMRESVRFYRLLGLKIADATDDHLDIELPGGIRLMFDTVEMAKQLDPAWAKPTGQPFALAFKCDSAREVDVTYDTLTRAGFRGKTKPFDAFWGQRYATVLDPDGNAVDLFAQLA
jgi:catechol 2,3-dioxygenase-like lactoylglutathione lyase family enzyme